MCDICFQFGRSVDSHHMLQGKQRLGVREKDGFGLVGQINYQQMQYIARTTFSHEELSVIRDFVLSVKDI